MGSVPFIELKVIPGTDSDPDDLGFSFTAEFKDSSTIQFTIEWQYPLLSSPNPESEDVLQITLWGPFMGKKDGKFIEQ